MDKPTHPTRGIITATLITGSLAVLFLIFFDASKHDPALAQANVFIDDPYDAAGSFGVQLGVLAALLTLVRILRPYPQGITSSKRLLILRGNAVALLSIAITLVADGVALLRYLPAWMGSAAGRRLALLAGGLFAMTVLAGGMVLALGRRLGLLSGRRPWGKSLAICLAGLLTLGLYPPAWRESLPGGILTALFGMALLFVLAAATSRLIFPASRQAADDLLDDLLALYGWARAHAGPASFILRWIEKAAAMPAVRRLFHWLNPRRNAWNFVILAAAGLGTALLVFEILGEGAPERSRIVLVAAVFIGIEGAGVLLGYILFRRYLGIFRS